jgi:tetratricopeptide (TPR) repeat protein
MDVESIGSGRFDAILKHQIAARPYFLLILTPRALDRCIQPGDWLSREIEHALDTQRVIVPIVTPEFSRDDISRYLSKGVGEALAPLNTVNLVHEYWEAAMEKLRGRFLVPIELQAIAPSLDVKQESARITELVAQAAPVTDTQMLLQKHLEAGWAKYKMDPHAAIAEFDEALRLAPDSGEAFAGRGSSRLQAGDPAAALADLDEAIRLVPDSADFHMIRAQMRLAQGDESEVMARDIDDAVRLDPENAQFRQVRGMLSASHGDYASAIADLTKMIELGMRDALSYTRRGKILYISGDAASALPDLNEALRLEPELPQALYLRGRIRCELDDSAGLEDLRRASQSDSPWGAKARASLEARS